MIRINDDWVVDVTDTAYVLKKDLHKTKTRKGEASQAYDTKGYYSTLSKALNALCEEMFRDNVKHREITLPQACATMEECVDEWRRITNRILEGQTE